MTLKKLSAEGRFECNLDEVVKGKVWAFVAVPTTVRGDPQFQLGIAIANEAGYNPVPSYWSYADTFEEMSDHADQLNLAEGKDLKQACTIVASTMGGFPSRRSKPNPEDASDDVREHESHDENGPVAP